MTTRVNKSWSRRSTLSLGSGLALTALAGRQESMAASQASSDVLPLTGEFVGAARPADGDHMNEIFVAVIADPPMATGTAQRVRAYLCDGHSFEAWFVGEAAGDDFSLTSEDGNATIEG